MDKDKVIQKLEKIKKIEVELFDLRLKLNGMPVTDRRFPDLFNKQQDLKSELSELKSAKEEVKSAEILSADEMLTNHFLDDNWEPNYQNIVKIMDKFHSQFQSVQSKEEKPEVRKEISRMLNIAFNEGFNQTKSKEFDKWCKYAVNFIFGLISPPANPVQSVKGEGERTADDFLTKQGYTKTVKYPDGRIVEPSFQRETVCQLLESYKHSESKDMYPKEFVEWLRLNAYVDPISHYWELINDSDIKDNYTTEKLFNHWSTVITKR